MTDDSATRTPTVGTRVRFKLDTGSGPYGSEYGPLGRTYVTGEGTIVAILPNLGMGYVEVECDAPTRPTILIRDDNFEVL